MLRTDRARLDLDGVQVGQVTEAEEERARWQINQRQFAKDKAADQRERLGTPPSKRPAPTPDEEDADGTWAANPHPANADKPRLTLFNKGRAR
jgi:sRNA-binding protein